MTHIIRPTVTLRDMIVESPLRTALMGALVVLSIVSAAASSYGLSAFVDNPAWRPGAFFLASFVTFAIMTIGIAGIHGLVAPAIGYFARLFYAVAACGAFMFSSATNFGALVDAVADDNIAREIYTSEAERLANRASAFADRYAVAAARADAVAVHSATMAGTEISDGGTCGGSSGPTQGPRADLRLSDQAMTTAWREHFTARSREAAALAAEISTATAEFSDGTAQAFQASRARIMESWAGLQRLGSDPEVGRVSEAAAERLVLGESGWVYGERRLTCPDPALEEGLRGLRAALDLPSPGAAPRLFEPSSLNIILVDWREQKHPVRDSHLCFFM